MPLGDVDLDLTDIDAGAYDLEDFVDFDESAF